MQSRNRNVEHNSGQTLSIAEALWLPVSDQRGIYPTSQGSHDMSNHQILPRRAGKNVNYTRVHTGGPSKQLFKVCDVGTHC